MPNDNLKKIDKLTNSSPSSGGKVHSITRRLIFNLVITVIIVSAITIVLLYSAFVGNERKELLENAEEFQSYLVGTLERPLWDLDLNSIKGICDTFSQNELVVKLVVTGDSGGIIYSMGKEHDSDLVDRSAKIYHRGEYLGKFEFSLTKQPMEKAGLRLLSSYATIMILIMSSLLIVAGFLFRRLLKNPLDDLDDIVRDYASGNYDARTIELPYLEFRSFGNVLSQMGEKINEQIIGLKAAEQKYRSIFENAVEGIFQSTPGPTGEFIRVNPAHAQILGYDSPEQILSEVTNIGEQVWTSPQARGAFSSQVAKGPVTNFETQMRHRDGHMIWVSLNARPAFDETGNLQIIEGIMLDISERKRTEEELNNYRGQLETLVDERTVELAAAKEQAERAKITAEEANQAKSDFLARMSHEIRTPLNAVTGLTGIVLKSKLTSEQRDYLNKVQIASNNLLAVINDILDFSKIEAGRLDVVHAPFDLDHLMKRLSDLFSNRMTHKGLDLIFTIPSHVPRNLAGDAGRLTQVLTNLVENAVKFTDKGLISIEVSLDEGQEVQEPKVYQPTEQVVLRFTVSDTGIGIDPDVVPTLFDPFTQVDKYLTREHEGTGLGLAICRRLAELMGGTIEANSIPGKGSTFSFTARLEISDKDVLRKKVSIDGVKALVVDDSDIARDVLSNLLESFKLNVTAVDRGETAVEELRKLSTSEDPYQLVLLDRRMPGIDGIETAKAIRSDKLPRTPKIILVTGDGREVVQEHIEAGVVDKLLLKPVNPSHLLDTIMELLVDKEASAAAAVREPVGPLGRRRNERRVLIVEDSELNRDVVVELVKEAGWIVEAAENGQIAVEMVRRSSSGYYDAVLMDIQMPVMDGYQATKEIRTFEKQIEAESDRPRVRIPIIALTAHALKGEREKCLDADMDDYLSKPIDEQELQRVLLKWIPS